MMGRLTRGEDGMAMGLAVILIVIVGVMGAGLLVFVRNDLQAVVQVNQGQQAFEAAEAGVQAAKRELLSNACPESYDGREAGTEDSADSCADSEESDWSYATVEDENDMVGRELNFDGKQVDVSIRHLPFHEDDDSCDDESLPEPVSEPEQHPGCAPDEFEGDEEDQEFFRVEALGESDNGNARRKTEAIYYTEDLGVPEAYYSPEDITLRGNTCISDVSVFSLGSIRVNNNGGGNGCDGEDGGHIMGTDGAYDNWQNTYNPTARSTSLAGFAAVDGVDVDEDSELGIRDFDGSNGSAPYQFVADPDDAAPGRTPITFPFDHQSQQGQSAENRLEFLKEEAQRQESETGEDTYRPNSNDITDWPDNADENTVVYIDAGGGETVQWKVNGGDCSGDEAAKGTLVVDGANLEGSGNRRSFSGATIVSGGGFDIRGGICWDGFVIADEEMTIRGTAAPFVSPEVQNRPGFYGVEQWSWRELYE